MSLLDYLFYSVTGICVVFAVLAFLMLIIKLLMAGTNKVESSETAKQAANKTETPAADSVTTSQEEPSVPLAPGVAGEILLYDTNPRDAAMIMAIVADELGKPLNELRFISIREVKE